MHSSREELRTRFEGVWPGGDARRLFDELAARYAEPHRHYHTLRHIDDCLREADAVPHGDAVELALWFHDAIYDTQSHDNEERSAEWASRELAAAGVDGAHVAALILATKHNAIPDSPDAALVVDADLSILGSDPARFDEYERDVRAEYAWVPEAIFKRERAKVLRSFLDRPSIYTTAAFRARLESRARENLQRSLNRLA
jgi:predicted metal-dependent HD superfamily phosphohydrolase